MEGKKSVASSGNGGGDGNDPKKPGKEENAGNLNPGPENPPRAPPPNQHPNVAEALRTIEIIRRAMSLRRAARAPLGPGFGSCSTQNRAVARQQCNTCGGRSFRNIPPREEIMARLDRMVASGEPLSPWLAAFRSGDSSQAAILLHQSFLRSGINPNLYLGGGGVGTVPPGARTVSSGTLTLFPEAVAGSSGAVAGSSGAMAGSSGAVAGSSTAGRASSSTGGRNGSEGGGGRDTSSVEVAPATSTTDAEGTDELPPPPKKGKKE